MNLSRVMFVIGRLKVAAAALAGSWLLVIVADAVLAGLAAGAAGASVGWPSAWRSRASQAGGRVDGSGTSPDRCRPGWEALFFPSCSSCSSCSSWPRRITPLPDSDGQRYVDQERQHIIDRHRLSNTLCWWPPRVPSGGSPRRSALSTSPTGRLAGSKLPGSCEKRPRSWRPPRLRPPARPVPPGMRSARATDSPNKAPSSASGLLATRPRPLLRRQKGRRPVRGLTRVSDVRFVS